MRVPHKIYRQEVDAETSNARKGVWEAQDRSHSCNVFRKGALVYRP
jgi:hypothetical protein